MTRKPRSFRTRTLGFVVASVMGFCPPASAQTPKLEISSGYQAVHALDETLPAGWYVEVAGNVNRWFGIVGEAGGAYKTRSTRTSTNRTADVASTLHTFVGGVRLSARINPRITLEHPVLIGGAHASVTADGAGVTLSPSETKFALQTGLGINLMVTDQVGVRVAADYRRVVVGDDRSDENEYRFTIGIVLPFGK